VARNPLRKPLRGGLLGSAQIFLEGYGTQVEAHRQPGKRRPASLSRPNDDWNLNEMSRDFTPDLNEFREPSPGPRESSRPTPEATRTAERTREETPRPEPRSAYVREPRPKDVPPRIPEPSCTTATGYDLRESESRLSRTWVNFGIINARIWHFTAMEVTGPDGA